jgi:DNA-binding MarR family transcriptional regulator
MRGERDRRRSLLQLTDDGLALLDRIAPVHVARLRESCAVFLDMFVVQDLERVAARLFRSERRRAALSPDYFSI